MASPIILQFDDEPVIAKYDAKEDELNDELSKFKQKYSSLIPDIEERFYFETDDDELHFKLGEEGEYSSSPTFVGFFVCGMMGRFVEN
jgi:hypothetical protein